MKERRLFTLVLIVVGGYNVAEFLGLCVRVGMWTWEMMEGVFMTVTIGWVEEEEIE